MHSSPRGYEPKSDRTGTTPLFDGINFSTWKFRMTVYLNKRDLLQFVVPPAHGNVKIEAKAATAAKEAGKAAPAATLEEKEEKENRGKQAAFAALTQGLKDSELHFAEACQQHDPQELWNKLVHHYESKSTQSKRAMRLAWNKLEITKIETATTFGARVQAHARLMQEAGEPKSKEEIVDTLLGGMTRHFYAPYTMIFEQQEKLDFENLIARYSEIELRDKAKNVRSRDRPDHYTQALAANTNNGKQACIYYNAGRCSKGDNCKYLHDKTGGNTNTPMTDKTCFGCGKKGHFKRECPLKNKTQPHERSLIVETAF
jgi:hypothetical protein